MEKQTSEGKEISSSSSSTTSSSAFAVDYDLPSTSPLDDRSAAVDDEAETTRSKSSGY